jgi:hypothetical protein
MLNDWKNPNWNDLQKVHDWKNYVSDEVILIWDTFTNEQKEMLANNFDELANKEDWD